MGRVVWVGFLFLMALMAGERTAFARFEQPTPCKNAYTQQQEITEGGKVATIVFRQMPVLPDSSPVSQYVRALGAGLAAYAPGYRWPYEFHVVASEEINAFALPGGTIFVNLGTVRAAETEAQLAGVLAHEISHVVMRHSTCNLTKGSSSRTGLGIASVISSVVLGGTILDSITQAGIGFGAKLAFTKMSREDEKQADLMGTDILYDAGYDPRGMPQFFETIQAKYGEGGAQMLSDHPNPGNRMRYVTEEIATLPPARQPKVTSTEFARVHALAMQEQVYTAREVSVGTWRQTGHYAAVAGGPGLVTLPPGKLAPASMGLADPMEIFRGNGYSVSYPSSWQKAGGRNGSAAFVPRGGANGAGITYGAIIESARWRGGVKTQDDLARATQALAKQLSKAHGGLEQAGDVNQIAIGGRPACSVELRGRSPLSQSGAVVAEWDWLVTAARPDGGLSYLIFIAPEADFTTIKPLYAKMLDSFQMQ